MNGATCISTGNGNWATGATWSCGSAPTCGDSIIIQAGHTVSVTATINHSGCGTKIILVVRGTLKFGTGDKLRLPCNSKLYVFSGGSIIGGGGGGNSNVIEICNTNEWSAGEGTYTGPGCLPPSAPGCSAILPIQLLDFYADICPPAVCLFWETGTEKNNQHFDVETSADGYRYESIARVNSKAEGGTSSQRLFYETRDQRVVTSQLSYYRLKQSDFDGKTFNSKIIVVNTGNDHFSPLSVFPNPNDGDFVISVKAHAKQYSHLSLTDIFGKIVDEVPVLLDESGFFKYTNRKNLAPGLYLCTVSGNGTADYIKISVK
ncbi:MAG: T9SS type A sorting domain-containing protein [Bacteroidota bacterium]